MCSMSVCRCQPSTHVCVAGRNQDSVSKHWDAAACQTSALHGLSDVGVLLPAHTHMCVAEATEAWQLPETVTLADVALFRFFRIEMMLLSEHVCQTFARKCELRKLRH